MTSLLWVLAALAMTAALALWRQKVALAREHFIRNGELPRGLFANLQKRRPELTLKDCQLVAQALRQFFLAYLHGGKQPVSMPSQVVDELWHEFILFTRHYEAYCRQAFGGFLHHAPAVTLSDNRRGNAGLRRVWWWACKADNINPRRPARLPLLFAIDAKLAIAGGFVYALDCHAALVRQSAEGDGGGGTVVHCAGDFGSDSFDGGTEGFGDGGGSSDGGGDGGGCGGGGCGS
jgi:hypothetical protein